MPVYDFSAPFVAARITLPDGSAFPLWTNVGGEERVRPAVPGTEQLQALAFVQEVQVRLNLSGLPQISVQMSPTFEDGMKFLDSPLANPRMQNRIEVQLGYASGTDSGPLLSPPFVASLQAPEVSIGMDVQITMKGTGLGSGVQIQGGRVTGQPRDKRRDIIERLAAGSGGGRRTLEMDWSAVEAAGTQSEAYQRLEQSAEGYAQGGRSDWLALWEMADLTLCVMNIVGPNEPGGPARLRWLPRRGENFTGPATRRYRLYHLPGGRLQGEITSPEFQEGDALAELPILSFSCNTEAVWSALDYQDILGHGAELNDVNADDVSAESRTVTVEDQAGPVDSGEGAQTLPGTDELPETPMHLPGAPDNPDAVTRAGNDVEDGGAMSVRCEIETIGDPGVMPGDIVLLAGLGRRFDNRVYHVFEVTHSIGSGGFSTNLVVNSNVDPPSEGNTPTGPANTADRQAGEPGFTAEAEEFDPFSLEGI